MHILDDFRATFPQNSDHLRTKASSCSCSCSFLLEAVDRESQRVLLASSRYRTHFAVKVRGRFDRPVIKMHVTATSEVRTPELRQAHVQRQRGPNPSSHGVNSKKPLELPSSCRPLILKGALKSFG